MSLNPPLNHAANCLNVFDDGQMLISGLSFRKSWPRTERPGLWRPGAETPSLLAGLLFDHDGNRMTPTLANKRGRRYRYYISAAPLDPRKRIGDTMACQRARWKA
jgi:hypothetical protein